MLLGFLCVIVIVKDNSQISFIFKVDYLFMAPHTDFAYPLRWWRIQGECEPVNAMEFWIRFSC